MEPGGEPGEEPPAHAHTSPPNSEAYRKKYAKNNNWQGKRGEDEGEGTVNYVALFIYCNYLNYAGENTCETYATQAGRQTKQAAEREKYCTGGGEAEQTKQK